ncbi:unnamed protein product [Pedinophyceae sp. YPF-701]|nr:unnamed protein product [Pedinophyceae sp. YPF-701]
MATSAKYSALETEQGGPQGAQASRKPPVAGAAQQGEGARWCPEEDASLLSRLGFFYMNGLMAKGYAQPLEMEDLWDVAHWDSPAPVAAQFERALSSTRTLAAPYGRIARGLLAFRGRRFASAGAIKLVNDFVSLGAPFLLQQELKAIQDERPTRVVVGLATAMLAATLLQTLLINRYFHIVFRVGLHTKVALVHALYTKSLRVSGGVRAAFGTGRIVNLQSNDAQKIWSLPTYLHMLWSGPLQIVLITTLLARIVTPVPALAGLLSTVAVIPLNILVGKRLVKIRAELVKQTDRRVKLVTEVITGIKQIKLYAWEGPYVDRIRALRAQELASLFKSNMTSLINTIISLSAPILVSIVTFAVYIMRGNELTADIAFPALALFNQLRFPIQVLPNQINNLINATVALRRMQEFLGAEELAVRGCDEQRARGRAPPPPTIDEDAPLPPPPPPSCPACIDDPSVAASFKNAVFRWPTVPEPASAAVARKDDAARAPTPGASQRGNAFTLDVADLKVQRGDLVMVVGQVGSGKSSLLYALLGEMERAQGRAGVRGQSVAYTAQDPWIQNMSLRENVLMAGPGGLAGGRVDEERYAEVLEACAMMPDLDVLPAGDLTEIGEKGINLSGGQRHRIALARAAYSEAETFLLDDPLSAVDAHVGTHIFEKCIRGYLAGKTRILVTHQLQYLKGADMIVVMEGGRVTHTGTYRDLINRGVKFALFENESKHEDHEAETPQERGAGGQSAGEKLNRRELSARVLKKRAEKTGGADGADGRLTRAEARSKGSVKRTVYAQYLLAWGPALVFPLLTIALALAERGTQLAQQFWLSDWANDTLESSTSVDAGEAPLDSKRYLLIYAIIGFAVIGIAAPRSVAIAWGSNNASRNLHNHLLERVARFPMSFFDSQPSGRLINRFTKDLEAVDSQLAYSVSSLVTFGVSVLGAFAVMIGISPVVIVAIFLLGAVYLHIQKIYLRTSREVKRLDSIATSPIFGHFKETLEGITTIRAFFRQPAFLDTNLRLLARSVRASWPQTSSNRYLSVRLESLGHGVVYAATLAVVAIQPKNSALVGLVISSALNLTGTLAWLVRVATDLEVNMNAVERLFEYDDEELEAPEVIETSRPPATWPHAGAVVAKGLQVRYRKELGLVLKGLSFDIAAKEKIGVCGRTGCGKSTLMLAMFRIVEPCGGSLMIDGVDVQSIGLFDLRSKMALVPQDPVIFSGTYRSNLDPFGAVENDRDIWEALRRAHLADFVSASDGGLDAPVSEGGTNMSVGQRQLLCMARALLRKARILLLDEATSNVDNATDSVIQDTIRTAFVDCTVLTIAHRLHTIIDADRIMLLERGEILEMDRPGALLQRPDSAFGRLVDGTSKGAAAALRSIASGSGHAGRAGVSADDGAAPDLI